ncbi:dynein regulatory complex protein 10 [Neoarius graeffei]|uniref:dynein regulatory complex protein 10 n=1 Tax=Neoarius graeffei TaxID=443677 RepID=UPI00298C3CF5|nr:dynein regulatory complex protein 10 [Neoarius graeffei]XP_060769358.1 dynein regulatory complex protein 10 [Neoarius graeffei]
MASKVSAAPPVGQTAPAALCSQNKLMPNNMAAASSKQFTCPEAQRIISVLDECVNKIDVLSLLPRELVHPERVSQELGDAAAESLSEHLRLSEEYRSLHHTNTRKDESMAQAVQDSLRNFLRHVRPHKEAERMKAALQGAGPIIEEDQKAVQELGAGLREFRDVLMERLMTMTREDRERSIYVQEVRERQERNAEVLPTLEAEVRAMTEHQEKMIRQKDGEIRRLEDSLHQMKRVWKEFVLQLQKKAEQQHQSNLKTSEIKCLRLQEEANQLQVQLEHVTMEHRESEGMLSKKNYKLETEIENWIQKYDIEMEEKQATLESVIQEYEEELAELRELQEHFAVLELEHSQIMEERRRERERREEEEREREMKSRAAIVIQAFFRGWKVRKAMKKKTKGKKGKKGKGKKK